jgi:hypothetical protein
MIRPGIHLAQSEEEKRGVFRLRYDIYVEEMGRYRSIADHENRLLSEPEDETSRIFYAAQDGRVVGTARFSWGGDAPFTERLVEHYQLAPFLKELPREAIAVGERGMVVPEMRGSEIFKQLGHETRRFLNAKRVQLMFGACEPHLLPLYIGNGARTFAEKNINSTESGYLIPIVSVLEDIEYLRRIGSPEAEFAEDFGDDARIPDCVDRLITRSGSVVSQRVVASGAYRGEINEALSELAENQYSALDDLTEDEMLRCLGRSNIIECRAGDRLLKKGGMARNMFVVLEGTLEVRDGNQLLRVLSAGDVFGEVAFLLERPRSADIFAATDGVRVLSLSEGTLRGLIESDPAFAAQLLLNISKILCLRLVKGG